MNGTTPLLPHTPLAIKVIISGTLEDPQPYFQGDHTDMAGSIDLRKVRGPVDISMELETLLGLRFTGFLSSNSPFKPPVPDGDPSQFRKLAIGGEMITFVYRNQPSKPYHIYAIELTDPDGNKLRLDPYIKNGPPYSEQEY